MRLLHVSDSTGRFGGGEVYIQRLLDLLSQHGHTVHWWAPSDQPPSNMDEVLALWNPLHGRELRRQISRLRADLLHVHGFLHRLSGSVFSTARLAEVPVVFTAHDFNLLCPRIWWVRAGRPPSELCSKVFPAPACLGRCLLNEPLKNLLRYPRLHLALAGIRRARPHVIAPSRLLYETLDAAFPELPCHYIPHFLPVPASRRPSVRERARDEFLYVGRLLASKGPLIAIRALARLPAEQGAKLVLAGDGPDADRCKQEASNLGVSERVEFLGHAAPETVSALMRRCAALLVPSQVAENSPLVIYEALASGAPVLASRIGGIPDLVDEGQTGYLFAPHDEQGLTRLMERLMALSGDGLQRMLNAIGCKAEGFTPERHYQALLEVYDAALTARHGPTTTAHSP